MGLKVLIIKGIADTIVSKPEARLPSNLVAIANTTYINTKYLKKDEN
jgi:hypothetical protein